MGVISPLIMNMPLRGTEQAAGGRHQRDGPAVAGCPILVRFANDLIAFCHTRQQAEQVQEWLARWMAPRALPSTRKRRRSPTCPGGWISWNSRSAGSMGKLLTKPNRDALRRTRRRLSAEVRSLHGANADAVIARLNPIIPGLAAYNRIGVSSLAQPAFGLTGASEAA
jgi:RNA-directed DNA polymerase